jgi:hypothetical protein
MTDSPTTVLVIYWEWSEGPHKGARHWAAHSVENDGRIRDLPRIGLKPIGAAKVEVREGAGLDLLTAAAAEDRT